MWNARQAADGGVLLFVRRDAVGAASAAVGPILGGVARVYGCEPGTWGPARAGQSAAELGAGTARKGRPEGAPDWGGVIHEDGQLDDTHPAPCVAGA
jgi:hypothetical protein